MNIHDKIAQKNGHRPMKFPFACDHDYENPIRKGRAHYVCPVCGQDITMELVLIADAADLLHKLEKKQL